MYWICINLPYCAHSEFLYIMLYEIFQWPTARRYFFFIRVPTSINFIFMSLMEKLLNFTLSLKTFFSELTFGKFNICLLRVKEVPINSHIFYNSD